MLFKIHGMNSLGESEILTVDAKNADEAMLGIRKMGFFCVDIVCFEDQSDITPDTDEFAPPSIEYPFMSLFLKGMVCDLLIYSLLGVFFGFLIGTLWWFFANVAGNEVEFFKVQNISIRLMLIFFILSCIGKNALYFISIYIQSKLRNVTLGEVEHARRLGYFNSNKRYRRDKLNTTKDKQHDIRRFIWSSDLARKTVRQAMRKTK